jgi:hypothetical protein
MIGVFPNADGSFPKPPADYERSMEALVTAGKGMVFMNHAMVEWPGWPLWREITGTSFMLRAGEVFGEHVPGSGYRGGAGQPDRNAKHFLRPATPGHPVLEGLGDGFEVVDELYLISPNFEKNPDIVPLLRSDFEYVQANFSPPPLAPRDEQAGWSHPKGSDLNVWAKRSRNSPVVVISGGDGPPAYSNPAFRKLLYNSIKWVASAEARAWARTRERGCD